jgi:hypothetical protein
VEDPDLRGGCGVRAHTQHSWELENKPGTAILIDQPVLHLLKLIVEFFRPPASLQLQVEYLAGLLLPMEPTLTLLSTAAPHDDD